MFGLACVLIDCRAVQSYYRATKRRYENAGIGDAVCYIIVIAKVDDLMNHSTHAPLLLLPSPVQSILMSSLSIPPGPSLPRFLLFLFLDLHFPPNNPFKRTTITPVPLFIFPFLFQAGVHVGTACVEGFNG